jgi:hypothetical protein
MGLHDLLTGIALPFTYIIKLLLNAVTVGTEALVSEILLCMPVSKKSAAWELRHVLTASSNSLLLKRCDPNQSFR